MPGPGPLSLALAAACAGACGGGGTERPDARPDSFDRRAMLDHLAHQVLLPIQEDAATAAAALPGAIDAYCDALDAGGDPAPSRVAAQDAWRAAMDAWQRADAVLVGPAAMDDKTIRIRIYSWPNVGTCIVDRDTVERWADPAAFDVATRAVNARSLAAVEYLLFWTGDHTCPTVPTGWAALGADVARARCRHAEALAADVADQAAALAAAWRPGEGDYAGVLANAGAAGSPIESAHAGVNLVSDGVFYVDTMVKDMKLGQPGGISMNSCMVIGEPCLAEVEHYFADHATLAIRANLDALREVFTGTTPTADGPAFDDFLGALGASDVATRMTGALAGAIAAADALPDSFLGALAGDRAAVVAAYDQTRAFTDDLKSQFLTVLALEIPEDAATDND